MLDTRILSLVLVLALFTSSVSSWRIIGGKPAQEGEFPFQVSIRRSYNDEHICGGVILTSRHILTAAHCMFYRWGGILPPIVISIVAGQLDLPITETSIYSNASRIIPHDTYKYGEWHDDIAIIELDTELPINSNPLVKSVTLRQTPISSGKCVVSGWGYEETNAEDISEILLVAEVDVVEFSLCEEMYSTAEITLHDSMMCAGHQTGETDACNGDSGGPLVCNGYLTGVVSTGLECGLAEFPGIYTDVQQYVNWIHENVDLAIATEDPILPPESSSVVTDSSPVTSSLSPTTATSSTPDYTTSDVSTSDVTGSSSQETADTKETTPGDQSTTPSGSYPNSRLSIFGLIVISIILMFAT